MATFNQLPPPSINSNWKYRFGEGWSRVHVEFEEGEGPCHIQLIKQTFWESVANIFLELLGLETFKPKVEDTRVIIPIHDNDEKLKKINSIRDQLLTLQQKGIGPASIKKALIKATTDAVKSPPPLSTDLEETPKAGPSEDSSQKKISEDESEEKSSLESEHEESAGNANSDDEELPLQIPSEKPFQKDIFAAPGSCPAVLDAISSAPVALTPLPSSAIDIDSRVATDSRMHTFMKGLGFGLLALSGVAAALYMLPALGGGEITVKPEFPPATPGLSLAEYDARESIRFNLHGLKTIELERLRELSLASHSITPIHLEINTIEKALRNPLELDQLAKRINSATGSVQDLINTLLIQQPLTPTIDTPLTALCETPLVKDISATQFVAFAGQATGGRIPFPNDMSANDLLLSGLDYLRGRLPLMGSNPEQRKIASGLQSSLSTVSVLEEKLVAASKHYVDALGSLAGELAKYEKEDPNKISLFDEKRFRQDIQQLWKREISEIKATIGGLFSTASERGFLLPFTTAGEFMHLLPEGRGTWTLRHYRSNLPLKAGDTSYQPFEEVHGLTEREFFLNEAFFDKLLSAKVTLPDRLQKPPFQSILPQVPPGDLIEPLTKKGRPHFANVHDFPLYGSNALNNLVSVELGPEAYLDFQISTIKHYIEKQAAELSTNPLQYLIAKQAVTSLAQASENAAEYGWIESAALAEKSRILRDMSFSLRRIAIQSKKHRLMKAPYADEARGQRTPASGKIPAHGHHPLITTAISSAESSAGAYVAPISLNAISVPLPAASSLHKPAELIDSVNRIQKSQQAAAETLHSFRKWTADMLTTPGIFDQLSSGEVKMILSNLKDTVEQLVHENVPNAERALAAVESAALADQLMHRATDALQGEHLPFPQMVRQLQALGVTKDSFHPQLLARAESLLQDDSTSFLFEKGFQDRIRLSPSENKDLLKTLQRGSRDKSASWDRLRRYGHDNELVFLAEMPDELQALYGYGSTDTYYAHLAECRQIIELQMNYSATMVAAKVSDFAIELSKHSAKEPQAVIDAILQWSAHFNPSAVARATLESIEGSAIFEGRSQKVIEHLGDIAQHLLTANFRTAKLLADPETMLAQLELLTFADQLLAYSKSDGIARFQLPLDSFLDLIEGNSLFFRTFDPNIDTSRLQAVKDWLRERKTFFRQTEGSKYDNPVFTDFPGFFTPKESYSEWGYSGKTGFAPNPTADLTILTTAEGGQQIGYGHRLDDFRDYDLNDALQQEGLQAFTDPDWVSPISNKPLPKWYDSLRKLSEFTFHTMRSGFINPLGENVTPTSFHPRYSAPSAGIFSSAKLSQVHYSLEGVSAADLMNYPEIPSGEKKGHLFAHLEAPIEKPGVLKNLREIHLQPSGHYQPGITPLPRDVYDLNNAMLREADAERGMHSSDTNRIKWSLRAERQLQPFLVISTYLEHPEWLIQTDEQIEFLNLLFEPGLLWHHLQEPNGVGPTAESDLAALLHTQYTIHYDRPELRAYLAEVGIRLHQYSAAARQAAPNVYADMPVPKELEALAKLPDTMLTRKDIPEEERSAYSALKAISFLTKEQLTPSETAIFFRSVLAYRTHNPLPMVNAMHIDRQINQLLTRFRGDVIATLYPDGQQDQILLDRLLNEIAGTANLSYTPSSTHPLVFMDAAGDIEINLQAGTLIEKDKEGVSLPADARLSSAYSLVHGPANYRGKVIDRFTFQFKDSQGYVNFIQKSPETRQWHLYRQFPDSQQPFQCVTPEWSQNDSAKTSQKPLEWLKSKVMLSEHTHWHRAGDLAEVRLLDHAGKQTFRIELSKQDGQTIKGIYKTSPSGEEWILADIDQEAYAWTRQFEDPGYIHVWLSPKTGQGQQVEFLRSGKESLSFSWKNNQWQLDSAPQYHVAKRQLHPLFPGQTNFLLLEATDGYQRLLLPRQVPNNEALTTNLNFARQTDTSATQQILTLAEDPKRGKFNSPEVEPKLYLAMMHLGHRQYLEAKELLAEVASLQEGRFSDSEMEILNWIIDSTQLPTNDTPQAIAIRTFAAHIKSDHVGTGRTDVVPESLKIAYLKQAALLADLRLPPAEEAVLFAEGIIAGELPLDQALASLQLSDPEKAREVLDAVLPRLLYGKKQLKLDMPATTSTSVPGPLSTPRPEVLSPQQIAELIGVTSSSTDFQHLPAELTNVFDYQSAWFLHLPKPTQALFKSYENGVRQFQAGRDHNIYELRDAETLTAQRTRLENEQRELTLEMEQQRLQVLELANPLPNDPRKAQRLMLRLEAGTSKPTTFEQLMLAFSKNDLRQYRALNPTITLEQAKLIDTCLQSFVDAVPEWQYRQNLIQAMSAVEKNQQKAPEDLQQALKKFAQAAKAGRKFPHDAKRLMKVMEYETGTYYRGNQVENLGKLGMPGLTSSLPTDTSAVLRMETGGGKTSRLLPSLLQSYAEEGKLALALMPEAQLPSAGKEFSRIMQHVYGISTLELKFTRTKVTLESLQKDLKDLQRARAKGKPVLSSGKSLRVLRNLLVENYTELVKKTNLGNACPDLLDKVKTLQELVKMTKVTPIIDEVHKEFESRVETNHPAGLEKALPQEYGILTLELYDILDQDGDIQKSMYFNFNPEKRTEGAKPFSQQRFKDEIAPLLAEKFLQRLQHAAELDPELQELSSFYQQLSPGRREDVRKYVLKQNTPEVTTWVASQSESTRDLLGLLRGELTTLMPTTLKRKFGQGYGYVDTEKDILPTPFSAADSPNIGSQFGSPFARYNYMLQALAHEGPRRPMLESILADMQNRRLKELNAMVAQGHVPELGKRLETQADAEFKNLFQTETWNLDTPNLADKLFDRVKGNPQLFRHLVKSHALNLVKVHPRNLKATSQHLGNMFHSWNGLSATPNNHHTYPGTFTAPQDEAVKGRMLSLMAKYTFSHTHTLDIRDPKQILTSPIGLRADAYLDAGGLLAAENLEALGDAWSAQTGKPVVRVDPEQGLIFKLHPNAKAVPLHTSSLPPGQRKTLLGQRDTVGTDIVQKDDAIALIGIDASTTISAVEQAAGRNRKIEEGQSVEFLILEHDAIIMRELLGLPASHQLTSEDVLRCLMINESNNQMLEGELALRHKLHAVVDNFVFNWLIESDPEEVARRKGTEQLLETTFFQETTLSPFELFGRDDIEMGKEKAFEAEIRKIFPEEPSDSRFVTHLNQVFGSDAPQLIASLKTSMETITASQMKYVNERIITRASCDMEEEQELLQEQTTEVQQNQQVEQQQEKIQQPPTTKTPASHKQWNNLTTESIATWSYWQPQSSLNHPAAQLVDMRSLLSPKPETKELADLFGHNLAVSNNYQTDLFFQSPQKPSQLMLVIKESASGCYRLAFIDSAEAAHFKHAYLRRTGNQAAVNVDRIYKESDIREAKSLLKDVLHVESANVVKDWEPVGEPTANGDAEIWGGSLSGRRAFGDERVFNLQDPHLKFLWVQAQVFAGTIDFPEDQRLVIREWLDSWATQKATALKPKREWIAAAERLIKKLMAAKEDRLALFHQSDLGKIFKELK